MSKWRYRFLNQYIVYRQKDPRKLKNPNILFLCFIQWPKQDTANVWGLNVWHQTVIFRAHKPYGCRKTDAASTTEIPGSWCGLLRIHVEVCLKPSLMRTYSTPALGLETAANDCKVQMHPQISTGSQLCAKGASISTRHGKIYCSSSWRVYCESLQPRNCIGQRCLWTRYHESRTWIMADLIPSKRSCWPGIFKFKTTKMKERFNISQSPICLAWNWSLFRWISPTKHPHWSGPVSPSRSMVDAQDASGTFSVTPCQQKLNFR